MKLILIIVLAGFLRFHQVASNPPALSWDEAAIGWNANSIFHTRRDEWGSLLPLSFRSYGDYKSPLYIYLSAPIVGLFGLSPLTIRLLSILAGTFSSYLVYLLALKLFKRQNLALVSAFLFALSPWSIMMSRAAFEQNLSLFFVLLFLFFFLKSLEKPKHLYWAAPFLAASVYSYHSPKIFLPPLLLALAIIYRKTLFKPIFKKTLFLSSFFGFILILPLLYSSFFSSAAQRFKATTIFYDDNDQPKVIQLALIKQLATNYLSHYTPRFLFSGKNLNYRQQTQVYGPLLIAQAPFLLIGLWQLLKQRRQPNSQFVLLWFLLGPLPAMVGREAPHEIRSFSLLPALTLISALGFKPFLKSSAKTIALLATVFVINFSFFYRHLLVDYPIYSARQWQYGYSQVAQIARTYEDQVEQIIITPHYGQPYIFTLVYQQRDPVKVFSGAMSKYLYPDINWPVQKLQPNKLFFLSPSEIDLHDPNIIKIIKFPDQTPAFIVAKT